MSHAKCVCFARQKSYKLLKHYCDSVVVTDLWRTCLVEVNVSLSQLISTLSREDHHTVWLLPYVLCNQVHPYSGRNRDKSLITKPRHTKMSSHNSAYRNTLKDGHNYLGWLSCVDDYHSKWAVCAHTGHKGFYLTISNVMEKYQILE